ncbi:uncharacterized protein LOC129750515 [Uranotaenia lowii]|uniref:uncharacterized protein LOC129750515 n=1 Tax=Uranotaenia lowii TaxID=190385 RepID=UPI002478ABCE|nr:uncharacterized protein LOC129750515 [Uranotaenia lowii]
MEGSKFLVEKLRSGGYESWRFKVEMLLVRENLWKYVREDAPEPPTEAWAEGDAKARATIVLLVDDSQHPLIRECQTARETWHQLKNHHQKTTMFTKVSLLKKLCRAEYTDNEDMENHLFRMDELFSSLTNAGQELGNSLKVAMVLKSMPDSFDTLTTALESRSDDELTMELVKSKLIDEAQKRAEKSGESILLRAAEKKPSLIGGLLHVAANTRPDIATSVGILWRSVSSPTQADWTEAKRVLRYLKSTMDHELVLGSGQHKLEAYSNADWASDAASRKSNTGYMFLLSGGPICWASKRQTCVALSSTEAKYVALAECCQELVWIKRLLRDFNIHIHQPTRIFGDNQACIKQLQSTRINNRSKHVDTKYHYVRSLYEDGTITVSYCSSEDMVADILIKPLAYLKLGKFREAAGVTLSRRSVEHAVPNNDRQPQHAMT